MRLTSNREAAASSLEATSGWRPGPNWLFVALVVSDATHTRWNDDGTAVMRRWIVGRAGVEMSRLALDAEFGGYRRIEEETRVAIGAQGCPCNTYSASVSPAPGRVRFLGTSKLVACL
jgi:hypothetical protein